MLRLGFEKGSKTLLHTLCSTSFATVNNIMLDSRYLFTRHRNDIPPPEKPSMEWIALDKVFQELLDEYERNRSPLSETQLVCDFSSNNLTFAHLERFTEWLEGSSLQIYALDLSMNRIFSTTWQPILDLVQRLCTKVHLVDLGGNYLPALEETAELKKVQETRRVSLAPPTFGSPVTDWQSEWTNIALEFGQQAYDPADNSRLAFMMLASVKLASLRHSNHHCIAGQNRILSTCHSICHGKHQPWQGVCPQIPD